jgi:transcriptional regulator with XRE-family HTH domain
VPRQTLADQLRLLREDAGLSQAELASRLGVKQQQVSKWEKGTALPIVGRLRALSEALAIDPGDLYAMVAEAAQTEAGEARRERDTLINRMERFAEKYQELGHTYEANHGLLNTLVAEMAAMTKMGAAFASRIDTVLRLLEEQETRLAALERQLGPPSGPETPPSPRRPRKRT